MEIEKDLIEKIIRENIEVQLADYYFGDIIKDIVREKISKQVEDKIAEIFEKEVETIFNEPIYYNDGWAHTKQYDNFEQLFKETLNKKLESKQEIHRYVISELNRKFDKLIEEKMNYITKKFSETIMKELADKEMLE